MISKIQWEKNAQLDREVIFNYLFREAGLIVASATDDKFLNLVELLRENPYAGIQIERINKKRKLIVPHFPFVIVYVIEHNIIRIIRILHTSRKIAMQYRES